MPSCVFMRCRNYTATVKDKKKISFHTLPRDDLIREKWIKVIRTQRLENNWVPTKYSTVCSDHFLEDDQYMTKHNVWRLKTTAVPVIIKQDEQQPQITEINLDPEEPILSSRREAYLKSTIKKIIHQKHKLQSKNYNLTRKNKRLKEKCNNLKEIVSELQRKLLSYKESDKES